MIYLWIVATLGWGFAIFYCAVSQARLTELRFTQDMLENAPRVLKPEETDDFISRIAASEPGDD